MAYPRNNASPPPIKAKVINASTGAPITSGVTAFHIQGSTRGAVGGTAAAHIANGEWTYTPTQAETNYSEFAIEFYHADAVGDGPVVHVYTAGGSGSAERAEAERLAGIRNWTIYGSDELFAADGTDGSYTTWPTIVWDSGNSEWAMFTSSANGICKRTSSDGKTSWSAATLVLEAGAGGAWDDGSIWCPNVWIEDGTWHMLYTGRDASRTEISCGYASSADGTTWTKSGSNPVISADQDWMFDSIEVTSVIKIGSTYYAWFTILNKASNYDDFNFHARKIGYATSTDLATWTINSSPVWGDADANSDRQPGFAYSPCIFRNGSYYYYMIVARYQANTDYSYFELWESYDPTFPRDERRRVGIIQTTQDSGTFPDQEVDIAIVATDDIGRNTFTQTSSEIRMYFGCKHDATWRVALSTQSSMLEALRIPRAVTEDVIDYLPHGTRWDKAAEDFEAYDGYTLPQMIAATAAVVAGDPTIAGTSVTWVLPSGTTVSVAGTVTSSGERSNVTWSFT